MITLKDGIKTVVALSLLVLMTGCAGGGGFSTTNGTSGWINPNTCDGDPLVLESGEVLECVSEEARIQYYQFLSAKQSKEAKYDAIIAAKDNVGALVLIAVEAQKSTEVKFTKSKTWDERLWPYFDTTIKVATGGLIGGFGNSRAANFVELKGNGNSIHIGDSDMKSGRDLLTQDYQYDYEYNYDMQEYNNQKNSPNSNNGEGSQDNGGY